mgnify:CR=1 FL=1
MQVTLIGGGMIANDQILPSLYHLQRTGKIGDIHICAVHSRSLRKLAEAEPFKAWFPGQSFTAHPSLEEPPDKEFPDLFKQVISEMPPRNAVIIAIPDQLHYMAVKEALRHDQHVLCVKPLVLKYERAVEIEKKAFEKGLFVGVEYHKRFDRRALLAKGHCESGHYGDFITGEAKLIEPYLYRNSNFQNWFTCDQTDPFVYVGCHYWDMVTFITGLEPIEVSVRGVKRKFPNGKEGYMWANGRIVYENGAILSITNGLGYPDDGGGSNQQCLEMYFEGEGKTGYLKHNDQYRGVEYSFLEKIGAGGSHFNYVNPDYMRMIPWEGEGYKPVGYGYDSIEANISAIARIGNRDLETRCQMIKEINEKGIIATPANSKINELVTEAARLSILSEGFPVVIDYGDKPGVRFKKRE